MKRSILIAVVLCLTMCAADASAQKKRKPIVRKPPAAVITAPEADLLTTKQQEADLAPGPADADGWKLYESKTDSFKLAFPPTPVVTDTVDDYGKKDGNRYYNPEPVTPANLSLTLMVTPLGSGAADNDFKRVLYEGW